MLSRREFLAATGGSLLAGQPLAIAQGPRHKRLAVVTTLWTYGTHAWHMAERFLHGYPRRGRWHQSGLDVVSAYVDQRPDGDLSASRSKEFGFPIYDTVAETLRCGGKELAVDAVLLIGEHGNYPINEYGQKLYPRYELFKQIEKVFRQDGRSVPVFNDKHLSWNFQWAKEMVDISKELKFPFLAGSSLPVTWRMPAIDLPHGSKVEEAMVVAFGPTDIYDFHALETLQCMMERRAGGETGVRRVESWRGEELWNAVDYGLLPGDGWDPVLLRACLSRSHTLKQPETYSHRYPTAQQMREWVKDPIVYRIEYNDGTLAHMLLLNGLVSDFTFAARMERNPNPVSTLFYLPPNPNVVYSAALMDGAERMFLTEKAPWPVERTLLTSGMVESCLQSLKKSGPLETPHLNVRYEVGRRPTFWRF